MHALFVLFSFINDLSSEFGPMAELFCQPAMVDEEIVQTIDGIVVEERAFNLQLWGSRYVERRLYERGPSILREREYLTEAQRATDDKTTFAFTCAGHRFWREVEGAEVKYKPGEVHLIEVYYVEGGFTLSERPADQEEISLFLVAQAEERARMVR